MLMIWQLEPIPKTIQYACTSPTANEVMNKGGFNLRKGNSNSSRVRKYIANCKNEEFKQIMQKKGDSVMS